MAQSFDDDKTISATEINQNLVRNLGAVVTWGTTNKARQKAPVIFK